MPLITHKLVNLQDSPQAALQEKQAVSLSGISSDEGSSKICILPTVTKLEL